MPRQITFSVHNIRNTTFATYEIGNALNFLGWYWDIQFIQVGSGRIQFHGNFASPSPYWAAWTNGFVTKISPTYNFHAPSPIYARYLTAKVVCHEFGHMVRPGGQHASVPGLMDASASQPTGNLSQNDCINWFDRAYAKTGRTRPWLEPNAMRVRFGAPLPQPVQYKLEANQTMAMAPEAEIGFGCHHQRPAICTRIFSYFRKP